MQKCMLFMNYYYLLTSDSQRYEHAQIQFYACEPLKLQNNSTSMQDISWVEFAASG